MATVIRTIMVEETKRGTRLAPADVVDVDAPPPAAGSTATPTAAGAAAAVAAGSAASGSILTDGEGKRFVLAGSTLVPIPEQGTPAASLASTRSPTLTTTADHTPTTSTAPRPSHPLAPIPTPVAATQNVTRAQLLTSKVCLWLEAASTKRGNSKAAKGAATAWLNTCLTLMDKFPESSYDAALQTLSKELAYAIEAKTTAQPPRTPADLSPIA